MGYKEKRNLMILDIVEAIISLLAVILLLSLAVIVKSEVRYIFLFLYVHIGYNLIRNIENIVRFIRGKKIITYSRNKISDRSLKDVSF